MSIILAIPEPLCKYGIRMPNPCPLSLCAVAAAGEGYGRNGSRTQAVQGRWQLIVAVSRILLFFFLLQLVRAAPIRP